MFDCAYFEFTPCLPADIPEVKGHPFLAYTPVCSLLATQTKWCSVQAVPMTLDYDAVFAGAFLSRYQVRCSETLRQCNSVCLFRLFVSNDALCRFGQKHQLDMGFFAPAGPARRGNVSESILREAFHTFYAGPGHQLVTHRTRRCFVRLLAIRCRVLEAVHRFVVLKPPKDSC